MPKTYFVVDWYDGFELLCKTTSYRTAQKTENQRLEDTDGECDIMIYDTEHDYAWLLARNLIKEE